MLTDSSSKENQITTELQKENLETSSVIKFQKTNENVIVNILTDMIS